MKYGCLGLNQGNGIRRKFSTKIKLSLFIDVSGNSSFACSFAITVRRVFNVAINIFRMRSRAIRRRSLSLSFHISLCVCCVTRSLRRHVPVRLTCVPNYMQIKPVRPSVQPLAPGSFARDARQTYRYPIRRNLCHNYMSYRCLRNGRAPTGTHVRSGTVVSVALNWVEQHVHFIDEDFWPFFPSSCSRFKEIFRKYLWRFLTNHEHLKYATKKSLEICQIKRYFCQKGRK